VRDIPYRCPRVRGETRGCDVVGDYTQGRYVRRAAVAREIGSKLPARLATGQRLGWRRCGVATRLLRVTAAAASSDEYRRGGYEEGTLHRLEAVSLPNNTAVPMCTLFLPPSAPCVAM
jgi:hypothetical protein